ncbi:hypothetical protein QA601_16980 [Chitinispirillales bacterium ANBcel5]|uniref:hypothetical protein n=1 Tax=Cellulosispirillum alkaliphilum TaxID=3039283 RepID=UPI002A55756A|nr:hypothetical protein [Chitinispirillales bacterium ANBcel5]
MNRGRRQKFDMGNPISMEDALSIMVVIFVLFFLFLVPLINMDRAKLEEAQRDVYWKILAEWIETYPDDYSKEAQSYVPAFGLSGHKIIVTDDGDRTYIEALSDEGVVTVIVHEGNRYTSFSTKGHSSVVTYRFGDIMWSSSENEWFTVNNRIDYGEEENTVRMQKEFRQWTKERRGF